MTTPHLKIDLVSDVSCPWCAIGLQALLMARAELAPAVATTQRAQYYRWMLFCANTLMPAYRAWFYPDEIAGEANIPASQDHARAKLEKAW